MSGPSIQLRQALLEPLTRLEELPLVLVSAPGGYGKSTLLGAWRDRLRADGLPVGELALASLHTDPALFVEDLVDTVRAALEEDDDMAGMGPDATAEGFGADLLRRLAPVASDALPPERAAEAGERLARLFLRGIRDLGEPIALLLDDYHRLPRGCVADALLDSLLRQPSPAFTLVIATRGARPRAAARLVAEGSALELGVQDLCLHAEQVERLVASRAGAGDPPGSDLVPLLLEQTGGWATGVRLAIRELARRPGDDAAAVVAELGRGDALHAELAGDLLEQESESTIALLEAAALLGPAPRVDLLEAAAGGPDTAARAADALERGLLADDDERISVHPLWGDLLRERLRRSEVRAPIEATARRCVQILEREGEPARAAELCDEVGLAEELADLLDRYGLDWAERGQVANVARWLRRVGEANVSDRASFHLLQGLLDARRDPEQALSSLDRAARLFHADGDFARELATLHNMLIIAANEGQPERVRGTLMRLLALRRLIGSAEARGLAILFGSMLAFVRGRYRIARRLSDRALLYHFGPRERGALYLERCQLDYLSGRWESGLAQVEHALADPEQRRHGPSFFSMHALRAFGQGVLGRDRERALSRLRSAREALADFRLRISEGECALFTARVLLAADRPAEAIPEIEHGLRVYRGVGDADGQTTAHALLARSHRELGDAENAAREARTALEAFRGADGRGMLRRRPWNAAGAAWVLAELGFVEEAVSFAKRNDRALDTPDVPLCQHATHLMLARIAWLGGDAQRVHRHLERAEKARADFDRASPELAPALLEWERTQAGPRAGATRADDEEAPLRIETLGGLRLLHFGRPLEAERWRGNTAKRLLLRLLCAGGRPIDRERLATDLWPDAPPARARGNLRVALSRLRRALEPEREAGEPDAWLQIDGAGIAMSERGLGVWDVHTWRRSRDEVRAARGDEAEVAALTSAAVDAYAGPFGPEIFDDWVLDLRGQLEEELLSLGRRGGESALSRQPDTACRIAQRLVEQVPADEGSWLLLVRAWLELGDRAAAARAALRAEETLRRELALEPSPELQALAAAARAPA